MDHIHHRFLAGADAGRDEHGAALRHHQEAGGCLFNFVASHAAGTFHDHLVWAVEQEPVTHDCHILVANGDVLLCVEKLGMVALGPQSARVVLKITEHGIELAFALQDAVVVALFPHGRQGEFPRNAVAAHLEAVDHMA